MRVIYSFALVSILLGGCETMPAQTQHLSIRTDPSCHLIRPLSYDRDADTDLTAEEIRTNNARACTCSNWRNTPECKKA